MADIPLSSIAIPPQEQGTGLLLRGGIKWTPSAVGSANLYTQNLTVGGLSLTTVMTEFLNLTPPAGMRIIILNIGVTGPQNNLTTFRLIMDGITRVDDATLSTAGGAGFTLVSPVASTTAPHVKDVAFKSSLSISLKVATPVSGAINLTYLVVPN